MITISDYSPQKKRPCFSVNPNKLYFGVSEKDTILLYSWKTPSPSEIEQRIKNIIKGGLEDKINKLSLLNTE